MASWLVRLTSFATVIALSGSPAALAACIAACGPDARAIDRPSGAVEHAAPASPPAVESAHAHHGPPAAHGAASAAGYSTSTPSASTARVGATCSNCCGEGAVLVVGPAAERADTHASGAAPMVVPVARFLLTTTVVGAAPHGPPVSPPPPSKALLVLRI